MIYFGCEEDVRVVFSVMWSIGRLKSEVCGVYNRRLKLDLI